MSRRTMFWITCALPGCGQWRETHRPGQRFCSRKCAAQSSPWRVECGRKGGETSAKRRIQRALTDVQRLWVGMPHEAAVAVREAMRRSYQAGWQAQKRDAAARQKERAA